MKSPSRLPCEVGPHPYLRSRWSQVFQPFQISLLTVMIYGGQSRGRTKVVEPRLCSIKRWATREVTPPDANVRSRVHEYGGGAWFVADGSLYYVEFQDQRIRRISAEGQIDL